MFADVSDLIRANPPALHSGAVRLAPYQVAWLYDRQSAAVSSSW